MMLLFTGPARPTEDTAAAAATSAAGADAVAVLDAVAALGPLDREALLLRFRDHASVADVATRTGTTPAMAAVRIRRAARSVEAVVGSEPVAALDASGRRTAEEVLDDARLGITPSFGERLDRALRLGAATRRPSTPLERLAERVRRQARQLEVLGAIGTLALATAIGLAGSLG